MNVFCASSCLYVREGMAEFTHHTRVRVRAHTHAHTHTHTHTHTHSKTPRASLNSVLNYKYMCYLHSSHGAGIACWYERRTPDQKAVSSNPGRSGGTVFFSRVNFVCCLIRCPFHPRATAVARKRPRSFCQQCRWQVTPKHAYTVDPRKSKWADYATVQA